MQKTPQAQFSKSPQIFQDIEQGLTTRVESYISQVELPSQVSEMICLGPNKNPLFLNPLEAAVLVGNSGMIDLLLKVFNPGDNESLCLAIAAGRGDTTLVESLLKDERVCPANTGRQGPTNEALCWAINAGKSNPACNRIALLLLQDTRVDPSAYWNRATTTASTCGNTFMLKILTEFESVDGSANDGLSMRIALVKNNNATAMALYLHLRRDGKDPYQGLEALQQEKLHELAVLHGLQTQTIRLLAPELTQEHNERPRLPIEVAALVFSSMHPGQDRVIEDSDVFRLTAQMAEVALDKTSKSKQTLDK